MKLVTTVLKNTKYVYLLVSSDEPLTNNGEWNVIMQQKINGKYLILIKKVFFKIICFIEKHLNNQEFVFRS